MIFGLDSPTTNPYNHSATPDVLEIVITENFSLPVCLTSCSALSSLLPVVIDTVCRSSFHHPPDNLDFSSKDWANFETRLDDLISFDPELRNEMAIDTCDENFSGGVLMTESFDSNFADVGNLLVRQLGRHLR